MDNTKPMIPKREHSIKIENRNKAFLTGIDKVISSNDNTILLETSEGGLSINGMGLKINKFDADAGEMTFEGTVNKLGYSAAKVPMLKKIFK